MSNAKVNRGINLDEWKGVLVIGEQRFGKILNVTYELLGAGRELADKTKSQLSLLILGNKLDEEVNDILHYGAEKVVYLEHALLENYTTDAYSELISNYILENKPESVLVGATSVGRDLAPRVAAKIGTGLTADCTGLDIDEKDFEKRLQIKVNDL